MLSRRGFLKLSIAGGAATYLATRNSFFKVARAAQSPQIPIDTSTIPQFTDLLPSLDAIVADAGQIELQMTEFQTQVLPASMNLNTWVWGYLKPNQTGRASYIGPVVVATRHQPTEIKFTNSLGFSQSTNVLAYKYSTDQTLHWADPLNNGENMWNHMARPPMPEEQGAENYDGPIPACPHLHGGYVPPVLDGGPDAWFTSDGSYIGHGYYSKDGTGLKNYCIYRYPNSQEAAPIWFHDHTLGATRLNVFMGLAGAYLIVDPANDPKNLPALVPLVIQDRMFDNIGQLFFPGDSAGGTLWALNPEHPYWVPEFIGDVICVNGKAWPYLEVQPKRYTFLFLNGSNARSYEMALIDPVSGNFGPSLWAISTDGGYLDTPAKIDPRASRNNTLIMMPGERYQVIIDFAGYQAGVIGPNGQPYSGKWLLTNAANAPLPSGDPVDPATTGKIMLFNVVGNPGIDLSFNPAKPGAKVRAKKMVRLVDPIAGTVSGDVRINKIRQLTLNEIELDPQSAIDPVTGILTDYPGGPEEILVNNTKWDGMRITGVMDDDMYEMEPIDSSWPQDNGGNYLSEVPKEGETEIWEIVNLTMDAHPIHTHLVQFQLMNRQDFDVDKYMVDYAAAFPGGFDYTLKQNVGPGNFIPAYGPPLNYKTGNSRALGGNPDIAAKKNGKPLYLIGKPTPPLPQEAGWKDVVRAMPGQVTRFVVRWGPTDVPADQPPAKVTLPFDPAALGGGYVWHCHIVDHEDNEMMRPDKIDPQEQANRTYIQGVDY
jgi:spore coat protein A, manganese oxidase